MSTKHFTFCLRTSVVSKNVAVKIFEAFEFTNCPFWSHEMFCVPGILFFIEHVRVTVVPLVPTIVVSLGRICSSAMKRFKTISKQTKH